MTQRTLSSPIRFLLVIVLVLLLQPILVVTQLYIDLHLTLWHNDFVSKYLQDLFTALESPGVSEGIVRFALGPLLSGGQVLLFDSLREEAYQAAAALLNVSWMEREIVRITNGYLRLWRVGAFDYGVFTIQVEEIKNSFSSRMAQQVMLKVHSDEPGWEMIRSELEKLPVQQSQREVVQKEIADELQSVPNSIDLLKLLFDNPEVTLERIRSYYFLYSFGLVFIMPLAVLFFMVKLTSVRRTLIIFGTSVMISGLVFLSLLLVAKSIWLEPAMISLFRTVQPEFAWSRGIVQAVVWDTVNRCLIPGIIFASVGLAGLIGGLLVRPSGMEGSSSTE